MDYDVIIVGAGAAGMAAARVFKKYNLSVCVLEASNLIGGRVKSGLLPSGTSFDAGAHWMHYGNTNVFKSFAESHPELAIYEAEETYHVFKHDDTNGLWSNKSTDKFDGHIFKNNAIQIADYISRYTIIPNKSHFEATELVKVTTRLPNLDSQSGFLSSVLGNWDMGKSWTEYAVTDYDTSPPIIGNPDHLCAQGFGHLFSRTVESDIDIVQLNTKVISIDTCSEGARVITFNNNEIVSKICILTCSTGVINSNQIEISGLSDSLREAYRNLPMGRYTRCVLKFTENVFGDSTKDEYHVPLSTFHLDDSRHVSDPVMVTNVGSGSMVYVDFGGPAADLYSDANRTKLLPFVKENLQNYIGANVDDYLESTALTYWNEDPLYLGCYASLNAGNSDSRNYIRDFREDHANIEQKIFFTGEAHHFLEWATVSGAHKAGCNLAQYLLQNKFGMSDIESDSCSIENQPVSQCKYFHSNDTGSTTSDIT